MIISNTFDIQEKKAFNYIDILIDLSDFLSVYLSSGHMLQIELDNPLDLKPDVDEKVFFCCNLITVSIWWSSIN